MASKKQIEALWILIGATVIGTTVGFLTSWAGMRGRPRPWGDPIPFADAVALLPKLALLSFLAGAVVAALSLFRDD